MELSERLGLCRIIFLIRILSISKLLKFLRLDEWGGVDGMNNWGGVNDGNTVIVRPFMKERY